jgi:hypothetical protein
VSYPDCVIIYSIMFVVVLGGSASESDASVSHTPKHVPFNNVEHAMTRTVDQTEKLYSDLNQLQDAVQKFCLNRMSREVKESCKMQ